MDKESIINPEFATSVHYGEPPIKAEELKAILDKDFAIYRRFEKIGYIHSKEFYFITYATFSLDINSELDGKFNGNKTPERKHQAKEMINIINNYVNEIYLDADEKIKSVLIPMKIDFIARHDNECMLYNSNRFSLEEIKEIFFGIFGYR